MSPTSPRLSSVKWRIQFRRYLPLLLAPFVVLALSQGEYFEKNYGEIVDTLWGSLSLCIALAGFGLRVFSESMPQPGIYYETISSQGDGLPAQTDIESGERDANAVPKFLLVLGATMFAQSLWLVVLATVLFWLAHAHWTTLDRSRPVADSAARSFVIARDAGPPRPQPKLGKTGHLTAALVREYPTFVGIVVIFTLIEWVGGWLTEGHRIPDLAWLTFFLAASMSYVFLKIAGPGYTPNVIDLVQRIRAKALLLPALLVVGSAIWFGNLDYRKLTHPDEGRYAEIPREMVTTGDWLTPLLNGIKYFEKPPLQYWATAVAYKAFGEHEWTARLWPALTGFLGVVFVYFTGRRLFGPLAGLYSALLLGSSLLYVAASHVLTLDMGTSFFMGTSLFAFLLAQSPRATSSESKIWMYVVWVALGLSVLSKGLIGVVLPGAVLATYSILQRDFALWKCLHTRTGSILFLLITAPWFVAVSAANPTFFDFFFIHEHFARFLTRVHGRYQPWWVFIPILLVGAMPWTLIMFDALRTAWRPWLPVNEFQPKRFLLIWAGVIFGFFSLSSSKLPFYILPIFPALAILTGARLIELSRNRVIGHFKFIMATAAIALLVTTQISRLAQGDIDRVLYSSLKSWITAAALVLFAGSCAAWLLRRREHVTTAFVTLALSTLIGGQLLNSGYDAFSPTKSSYSLAMTIKPLLRSRTKVYSVGMYDQTLPFYLGRTVTLVGFKGELEFGLEGEPRLAIDNQKDFERLWREPSDAVAVMSSEKYAELKRAGLPMIQIRNESGVVAVGNAEYIAPSGGRHSESPKR